MIESRGSCKEALRSWHALTRWCSRASRCGTRGSSSKTPDTDTSNTSDGYNAVIPFVNMGQRTKETTG
ncbi:hypothetical protein K0M31_013538 [Melipona bicolor]|uniref:Uncharacterized protein n=1 Tax=Melipona bicolor TaxID=60889 RepID=A0AA40FI90_9HYME|nr:hypothetical protein K0M31_013538 [Melipona bicolor]